MSKYRVVKEEIDIANKYIYHIEVPSELEYLRLKFDGQIDADSIDNEIDRILSVRKELTGD